MEVLSVWLTGIEQNVNLKVGEFFVKNNGLMIPLAYEIFKKVNQQNFKNESNRSVKKNIAHSVF